MNDTLLNFIMQYLFIVLFYPAKRFSGCRIIPIFMGKGQADRISTPSPIVIKIDISDLIP